MKIQWLGHSCFLITTANNTRIITDPYAATKGVHYNPINTSADIVTLSHDHWDHGNSAVIKGNPEIIKTKQAIKVKNIEFRAIPTYHDEASGSQRGPNLIYCFKADGMTVCHMGDLGHTLSRQQLSELGPVDILFIPIGGFFTIDAATATKVIKEINPGVVFPMHYKTAKLDFPVDTEEKFIKGKAKVRKLAASEVDITKESLAAETEIIILQSAN